MREGERERKRGLKLARIFSGLQLVVAFLKLADFVHLQLRAITCVCVCVPYQLPLIIGLFLAFPT